VEASVVKSCMHVIMLYNWKGSGLVQLRACLTCHKHSRWKTLRRPAIPQSNSTTKITLVKSKARGKVDSQEKPPFHQKLSLRDN